jgi:hypothetical protein
MKPRSIGISSSRKYHRYHGKGYKPKNGRILMCEAGSSFPVASLGKFLMMVVSNKLYDQDDINQDNKKRVSRRNAMLLNIELVYCAFEIIQVVPSV